MPDLDPKRKFGRAGSRAGCSVASSATAGEVQCSFHIPAARPIARARAAGFTVLDLQRVFAADYAAHGRRFEYPYDRTGTPAATPWSPPPWAAP